MADERGGLGSGTRTYRLLLAVNPGAPVGNAPRAQLEPALDAWIGRLLGPLSQLGCCIRYWMPPAGSAARRCAQYPVRIDQLGLDPIDVALAFDDTLRGELGTRLDRIARRRFRADHPADEISAIEVELEDSAVEGRRPIGHCLPLLDRLREMLRGGRPATRRDFLPHNEASGAGIDVPDLLSRVRQLFTAFEATLCDVESAADGSRAVQETALMAASQFALPDAVPRSVADLEALGRQLERAACHMRARREAALALWPQASAGVPLLAPEGDLLIVMRDTVAALFGQPFPLLPRVDAIAQLCAAALSCGERTAALGNELLSASDVHEESRGLRQVRALAAEVGANAMAPLVALQWPEDYLSVIVQPIGDLDLTQPVAGLVLGEWNEVVLGGQETAEDASRASSFA